MRMLVAMAFLLFLGGSDLEGQPRSQPIESYDQELSTIRKVFVEDNGDFGAELLRHKEFLKESLGWVITNERQDADALLYYDPIFDSTTVNKARRIGRLDVESLMASASTVVRLVTNEPTPRLIKKGKGKGLKKALEDLCLSHYL